MSILRQTWCEYTCLYLLGKYLRVWLLDCNVRLFLLLKATATPLCKWAMAFYIPTSSAWECLLFYIMPVSFLHLRHSNRCRVESYFHLCFPNHIWFSSSLPMLICYLYIFFDKVLVQIFAYPLNWFIFKCSLYFLDTDPLSHMWLGNILSQSDLSFCCR